MIQGSGFRVQSIGLRVEGLRVSGSWVQTQEERGDDGDGALFLLLRRLQPLLPAQLVEAFAHEHGEHRLEAEDVHEALARRRAPREGVVHALEGLGFKV